MSHQVIAIECPYMDTYRICGKRDGVDDLQFLTAISEVFQSRKLLRIECLRKELNFIK